MIAVEFRGQPHGTLRRAPASIVVTAILVAGVLTAVGVSLRSPHFVPRVTLVNPTAYEIGIDVTGGDHSGWTGVGYVGPRATADALEIYDVGDVWVFRLTGQGADGGELSVTRAQLERQGWKLQVPAAVGEHLRAEGAPPTP
jgi:hypothetical protein